MKPEVRFLGRYTVNVPPNKRGVDLITYLVEIGEDYASEEDYVLAAVVPMRRNKDEGEDTIDIQVYVYEE